MFKKYWLEAIGSADVGNPGTVIAPKNFRHQADQFADAVAKFIHRECVEKKTSRDRAYQLLKQELAQDHLGMNGLTEPYALVHSRYKKLTDNRRQEIYADLLDRFRFLLFRTLTAISIALVILCTAYLAKTLDIPLPLLRLA